MAAFFLVPLSIAAGVVAGRIAARNAVREEMNELRAMLRARDAPMPTKGPLPDDRGSTTPSVKTPEPQSEPVAPVVEEGISPEVLMVLTAAVAAFLGKKARIRRASVAPSPAGNAWAQQGRVFVQGSHALNVQHR